MKSQTDMIVSIVAVLLALIMAGVFFGTKPEPATVPPPEVVNTSPPQYPQGSVVFANGLNGAGGGAGGGGLGAPGGAVGGGTSKSRAMITPANASAGASAGASTGRPEQR